jgi:hypothetical protein
VAIGLNLVPFAFLGSGPLFVGMLFVAAATVGALVAGATSSALPGSGTLALGRNVTTALLNVYAMRMAAVLTLTTVTIARRTHPDRLPVAHAGRAGLCAGAAGRDWDHPVGGIAVPLLDPGAESGHSLGRTSSLVGSAHRRALEPGVTNGGGRTSAEGERATAVPLSASTASRTWCGVVIR